MNKNAIQKFAIWARTELIAQVSQRAYQYGIDETGFGDPAADTIGGRVLTPEEKSQRQELVKQIQEKGYPQVVEEAAYTWFNRFIALRFMEVNNYLPSHIRVFSDGSGAFKPEILNDVLHLDLPGLDRARVEEYIESNDTEALYRYLLLVQCNALNESLPVMFERMGGYTEMLLPNNILRPDSVLGRMVMDIPEEDWTDQVQIIGWLYQYYNAELKDDTFALLKKNVKITKERIPAATQLFTPDWIVKYMVENSLGRLWLEGHPNGELRQGWRYYLDEAEQEQEVEAQLVQLREEYKSIRPEDIKVIDPCMGSGHVLVYAFDILMRIYTSAGWNPREAARSILEYNLYGLDIDTRAAQLAYFAVMMKARQYDRKLLTQKDKNGDIVAPRHNIYAITESGYTDRDKKIHYKFDADTLDYFANGDDKLRAAIKGIIASLVDAKEYGSIVDLSDQDWDALDARFVEIENDINIYREIVLNNLRPVVKCAKLLAQNYDVVVTNPPYMAVSNGDNALNKFIKDNYPDSKGDLFAVFIERCGQMAKRNGYQAMITQHSWMFLSSFEKLRAKLLAVDLVNMAHLGARAFEEIGGEVVQTTSFVIRKSHVPGYKGEYCRLIEPTTQQGKEDMFLVGENRYAADQSNFSKIPGSPVAYWVSQILLEDFSRGEVLKAKGDTRQGMATSDNNRFLRLWYEVAFNRIGFGCTDADNAKTTQKKWYPYNKGGEFRKWYGNIDYTVNYENDGYEVKKYAASLYKTPSRTIKSMSEYFKPCLSWSKISSGSIAFRYYPEGFVFDVAGCCIFYKDKTTMFYDFGFVNSIIAKEILSAISPTLNYEAGHIASLPIIRENTYFEETTVLVRNNISLSKQDWDSYETSWDFKRHPLL